MISKPLREHNAFVLQLVCCSWATWWIVDDTIADEECSFVFNLIILINVDIDLECWYQGDRIYIDDLMQNYLSLTTLYIVINHDNQQCGI